MDFDAMAYPDQVVIDGADFRCRRNMEKGTIMVPYTDAPDVGIGDVIVQKAGKREIQLKVLDAQFLPGGTLQAGTEHQNLLTLKVTNLTAQPHSSNAQSSTYNIGSISASQVQVGNNNSLAVNISVQHLAEAVAKSNDEEAKSALKKLLENNTVASIAGAGVSALLAFL